MLEKPVKRSEKYVQSRCCTYAKSKGCRVLPWVCPWVKGVTDRIMITRNGITFYFEMKATNGKLSDSQQRFHADLHERGCLIYCIRDVEEGKKIIDSIVELRIKYY